MITIKHYFRHVVTVRHFSADLKALKSTCTKLSAAGSTGKGNRPTQAITILMQKLCLAYQTSRRASRKGGSSEPMPRSWNNFDLHFSAFTPTEPEDLHCEV